MVAVGGTSLKLASSGKRNKETVWNDSGRPSHESEFKQLAATGGGCSTVFAAPTWQQDVAGWSSTTCGGKRLDNDVAAVADPYTGLDIYDSYVYEIGFKPGWLTIGGTSLSSPLVTGLYALAGGAHGVSYPASTLYAHAGRRARCMTSPRAAAATATPKKRPGAGSRKSTNCSGTSTVSARQPATPRPASTARRASAPRTASARSAAGAGKPAVVTEPATSITASSATLNATVNPNGWPLTGCSFEYGPTTSYGKSAPCSPQPGSGNSPVAVAAQVTGLTAKKTYHFRIVATNAFGAGDGHSKRFKTP